MLFHTLSPSLSLLPVLRDSEIIANPATGDLMVKPSSILFTDSSLLVNRLILISSVLISDRLMISSDFSFRSSLVFSMEAISSSSSLILLCVGEANRNWRESRLAISVSASLFFTCASSSAYCICRSAFFLLSSALTASRNSCRLSYSFSILLSSITQTTSPSFTRLPSSIRKMMVPFTFIGHAMVEYRVGSTIPSMMIEFSKALLTTV